MNDKIAQLYFNGFCPYTNRYCRLWECSNCEEEEKATKELCESKKEESELPEEEGDLQKMEWECEA